MHILEVPIKEIHADASFNSRGVFSPIDVVDLAKDIEQNGLISPVTIMEYPPDKQMSGGYKYRLIAGFRRHYAHIVLKKPTIMCSLVSGLSEVDARILNLNENLQRKDLNILQEAKAIKSLYELGCTQDSVSKRLGVSRTWVTTRFQLLSMPEEVQQEAAAGLINTSHILSLSRLKSPEKLFEAVRKIKDAKLRGEKIKASEVVKSPKTSTKHRDKSELREMRDHIQDSIGNNFGTRCLAWAAGDISTEDLYGDIQELAKEREIEYSIPVES